MKVIIFLLIISGSNGIFNGCPMDGCESTLSSFVDIHIDGFNKQIPWQRTDLLNKTSRGCVSNSQYSLICVIDSGYAGFNMTNGQLLWSVPIKIDQTLEEAAAASLPIVNSRGYSIISNSSRSTLISPAGDILGTFNYVPKLQSPLAGPVVTNDGQIIVADSTSFVGIEDSGIPLGILALPSGFLRLSRSLSLNPTIDRWYLITQHNTSSIRAIVAAETTGQIVERLRIAWIYEYETKSDKCNGNEGPLLSIDRQWLFLVNSTGILIISDDDSSASTKSFLPYPNICTNNLAFSESDSTLFIVDKQTLNIILYNISTQNLSNISLSNISGEEILYQISRLTLIQDNRMIITVMNSRYQPVVLLIDYKLHQLISHFDFDDRHQTIQYDSLTQLVFTQTNDQQNFLTIAHPSTGLVTLRLD